MKNAAANAEPKMQVVEGRPGSLLDPGVWDRANREAEAKRQPSTREDFDLPQLEHMLKTIRERRADSERSVAEAEEELRKLDERETAARDVIKKFSSRTDREARLNVDEANAALETIEELRPWTKGKAERARNLVADAERREKEFPRDLYDRLRSEDRALDAMRTR